MRSLTDISTYFLPDTISTCLTINQKNARHHKVKDICKNRKWKSCGGMIKFSPITLAQNVAHLRRIPVAQASSESPFQGMGMVCRRSVSKDIKSRLHENLETEDSNFWSQAMYSIVRSLAVACFAGSFFIGLVPILNQETPSLIHDFLYPMITVGTANAAGLIQMPPSKLNNTYFLVRAGESEWESFGLINTNPVAKTNMDNGLSMKGKEQAVAAALNLKRRGVCNTDCWIWPSITQRAYQAAEIIAYANGVTYSRIVPEYSFLDARGVGSYEGRNLAALDELHSMDAESANFRPPPFTDGTPNESVADVLVRVTQLMSILETQYSSDNIIIVSPDSDNLSVLQAALTGLNLRKHDELKFYPGEVRELDISHAQVPPAISGYLPFVIPQTVQ